MVGCQHQVSVVVFSDGPQKCRWTNYCVLVHGAFKDISHSKFICVESVQLNSLHIKAPDCDWDQIWSTEQSVVAAGLWSVSVSCGEPTALWSNFLFLMNTPELSVNTHTHSTPQSIIRDKDNLGHNVQHCDQIFFSIKHCLFDNNIFIIPLIKQ